MNTLDNRIVNLIKKHHVFTMATSFKNKPWCCSCFYAYLEDNVMLVFTSDNSTRHASEMNDNPIVAGSIVLETKVIGKIQGIQFSGEVIDATKIKNARSTYLKRFPFAALMDTTLWVAKLNYIKLTDNKLGFGKKLIWQRE
jgi:uncharacterized protein YhbP (UPF0306 family)